MNELLVLMYILIQEGEGSITDSNSGTSYFSAAPQQRTICGSHFHLAHLTVLYE